MKKKILITGCAGFIGNKLLRELIKSKKYNLHGIDNINNYYKTSLKKNRLALINDKSFTFYNIDICNKKKLLSNFKKNKYDYIFHLAAQAGVRYSIINPQKYFDSNIKGFFNILEACKIINPKILFFASSSSVYGDLKKMPLKEKDNTDKPKSFYAATKKCNEIMSYSYHHIYKLKIVGLRFFTVYGPFGRPDMTPFSFLDNFFKKRMIKVFNRGNHQRDFTYIDDSVKSVIHLFNYYEKQKKKHLFEIYNIARGKPEKLSTYINEIEKKMSLKLKKKYVKRQLGDVIRTYASTKKINKIIKYRPQINLKMGINHFIEWYKSYHNK